MHDRNNLLENLDWKPVISRNLKAVAYNWDKQSLFIQFQRGDIYEYFSVYKEVYARVLAAPLKGHYFNSSIKDRYRSVKIK